MIAIVQPKGSTFCVLIKLIELFENDILFQWEVRNVQWTTAVIEVASTGWALNDSFAPFAAIANRR
jgi:hypothetical protein